MRFTCPSCAGSWRVSRDRLGRSGRAKIRCPGCRAVTRVDAVALERQFGRTSPERDRPALLSGALPRAPHRPDLSRTAPDPPRSFARSGLSQTAPDPPGTRPALMPGDADAAVWLAVVAPDPGPGAWEEEEEPQTAQSPAPEPEDAGTRPPEKEAVSAETLPAQSPSAEATGTRPSGAEATGAPPLVPQAQAEGARSAATRAQADAPQPVVPADPSTGQALFFLDEGDDAAAAAALAPLEPGDYIPTADEYFYMLAEFGIMLRLDRHSRRMKWVLGLTVAAMVGGVVAFGLALADHGRQRAALMRDSKAMLAAFTLPYQTAVTVSALSPREEREDGPADAGLPRDFEDRQVSRLADVLLRKTVPSDPAPVVRAPRRPRPTLRPPEPPVTPPPPPMPRVATPRPILTAAEIEEQLRREIAERDRALRRNSGGGRVETGVPPIDIDTEVTPERLQAMCRSKSDMLFRCSVQLAGGAAYQATLVVSRAGRIRQVVAHVAGRPHPDLSACAMQVLRNVDFRLQPRERTWTCQVRD